MAVYNWIIYKCPRILIMHFYRLVWFHIQRRFCASLYIRVSNSGEPVTYTRQFCTNKPGHKLHRYMPAGSTIQYILLNNNTIIHWKKTFASACHLRKKISLKKKLSHSSLKLPHLLHKSWSTSKYNSNTNSSWYIYLFISLGLWLAFNQLLARNRYTSLHATTQVAYYFLFLNSSQVLPH